MSDIGVGLFVIVALLSLAFLALRVSGLAMNHLVDSYTVHAMFDDVGDLKVRAPVTIAGVQVGRVSAIQLDPESLRAVVFLQIGREQDKIPIDTSASIFTEGLLGSNYIALTPGVDDARFLTAGARIQDTHSAVILENLIGQLLFNVKKGS